VSGDPEVKLPLEANIVDGVLTITVNAATVKFATEHHEAFYDADNDVYLYKVADPKEWLESVVGRITNEREDGSTLLTDLFDKAIENAVEQGDEGLA
jgi:hypothetical protein